MARISYAGATYPVREDLAAAHARAWDRLAAAGTWWTGAERVAIAAETRAAAGCRGCRERRASLSPFAVATPHDAAGKLGEAAVEAVHRIASDPARLTRAWFERTRAALPSDAHYVELLGVLVTVISIDAFCRGIGVPLHPLPEPRAGEPARLRPAAARDEGAWVPMLPPDAATGDLADLWRRGRSANVIRALSLVPDEVRGLRDLSAAHYLGFDEMMDLRAGNALDRTQIELVAGRVSALRECFY